MDAAQFFTEQFEDSLWRRAALVALQETSLEFDAPQTPHYVRWWVVEAGVHMNPYFFALTWGERARFNALKEQLPMY